MQPSNHNASPPARTPGEAPSSNGQHPNGTRPMLDAALEMASLGWRVFPVRPPKPDGTCSCGKIECDSPGKHPAIRNWQDQATTSENQIRAWWADWPRHNIGIATGSESNLLVLDADGPEGRSAVETLGVPSMAPMVRTGRLDGGIQWYFACPQALDARNFAGKIPHVDARANGGYVVAAGSLHASQRRYAWIAKPTDDPLPDPPTWLVELLKQARASNGSIGDTIPSGERNSVLSSLAGTMRRRGMSVEAIFAALQVENATKCEQPLPDTDLEVIASSVGRYDPEDPFLLLSFTDAGNAERFAHMWGLTTRWCVEDKDWLHCDLPGFKGLWKPATPKVLHIKAIETARRFQIIAANMPVGSAKQQEDRAAIREWGDKLENDRAQRPMRQMASALLAIERSEFDTNRELLPALNGVIELRTGKLLPHDPTGYHRSHSPVEYDPAAQDAVFDTFLNDTTAGVPGMRDALQLRAGYFATGYTREEGLDFLVGPGGSGKSTWAEAVMTVLGGFAIAMDAETFMKQDLSTRSHTEDLMQLEGKRFAVVQEPDDNKKLRTGLLKKLTGSDMMRGRGIYEKEREFRNQAKIVFAFNSAPPMPTTDSGMERRLWVWPFNNARAKDARDYTVKSHLLESDEGRKAVLAWVVAGAVRYLALEKYPTPEFVQSRTKELWEDNDIIARFVEEQCSTQPNDKTQYTPLWSAFERFSRHEGGQSATSSKFRKWLDAHGYVSQRANGITTRKGINWVGDDLEVPTIAPGMEGLAGWPID